ncbi:MAG: NMD3-related protein [Candidatus Methanomethylophilaceae archaeon]
MFCVNCGIEGEETIDGLCLECFLKGKKLIRLPHHIDLFRCTNCEEYSVKDGWVQKDLNEAIEDAALTGLSAISEAKVVSVATMSERQDDKTFVVRVEADLDIGGRLITDNDSTIIRLKNTVCKRCSRQLGNYYEAIMQIRSGSKDLDDGLRDEIVRYVRNSVETQAKNNRHLFIGKVVEVAGGVDIYISSISMGRSLTKEISDLYGAESKESFSQAGTSSDGQDINRLTFLIRFPDYHTGDVVLFDKRPYKLTSLNKAGGKLLDLATFRETSVRKSDLSSLKVLAKKDQLLQAIVVSTSENEIQVMHPSNFSTIDLRIPEGAEISETVTVVGVEEEIFYVP